MPGVVGVPEICPEAPFRVRPAGRELKTPIENVYGALPPVTTTLAPYEFPTAPFGRLLVEIASGIGLGEIVIERLAVTI